MHHMLRVSHMSPCKGPVAKRRHMQTLCFPEKCDSNSLSPIRMDMHVLLSGRRLNPSMQM
jgi:hypothetical protein